MIPESLGDGEEAYQRSRYEETRRASSATSPSRLVTSPRWALTGGARGEGQLVNHSSHLGPITTPTRVGGLGAEARRVTGTDRALSLQTSETHVRTPDRREARVRSPYPVHEQPIVEVIGVDGRRREGLSLSPRTDSSVLRRAPLDVQTERRLLSRSPSRTASSALSVLSAVRPQL